MASNRVKWMSSFLRISIPGVSEEAASGFFSENVQHVKAFLKSTDGNPVLLISYESLDPDDPSGPPTLSFVSDIKDKILTNRCVYFCKPTMAECNLKVGSDENLLGGQILPGTMLSDYYTLASQIFQPILDLTPEWGEVQDTKQQIDFMKTNKEFLSGISRDIANIDGDITLDLPEEPYAELKPKLSVYQKHAADVECVQMYKGTLSCWITKVDKYLKHDPSSDPEVTIDSKEGPEDEINFWQRRMLTLTR
eukprot:867698_1